MARRDRGVGERDVDLVWDWLNQNPAIWETIAGTGWRTESWRQDAVVGRSEPRPYRGERIECGKTLGWVHGRPEGTPLQKREEVQFGRRARSVLVVGEEAGLGCGGGWGFAAGYADYAEDGEFAEGGAGDEDAVGAGIQVGRGDVETVVEEAEEVVGDDAFERVTVDEAEADPEAIEFWAAEESFALGFEIVGKFADEIDRANFGKRNFFVLTVGGEQVDGVGNA